jgi:hypothetical protein
MITWTHPELGEFEFDGFAWRKAFYLPAFSAFTQPCGRSPEHRGEVDAHVQSIDQTDFPTPEIADLLSKVIRNHEQLIPRIVAALIADILGTGPQSGTWWHRNVASIEESIARLDGISPSQTKVSTENIKRLLSPPDILIRDENGPGKFDAWRDGVTPVAEFVFSSPIEVEHGIGVLTDGEEITGIGFAGDARGFGFTPRLDNPFE